MLVGVEDPEAETRLAALRSILCSFTKRSKESPDVPSYPQWGGAQRLPGSKGGCQSSPVKGAQQAARRSAALDRLGPEAARIFSCLALQIIGISQCRNSIEARSESLIDGCESVPRLAERA
jgi:hypothetical protein